MQAAAMRQPHFSEEKRNPMRDEKLTMEYRKLDERLALLSYRISGSSLYEKEWFCPDADHLREAREELTELTGTAEALSAPDAVYAAVKNHLTDFCETLRFVIDDLEDCPVQSILGFTDYYLSVVRLDKRDDPVRLSLLTRRFRSICGVEEVFIKRCRPEHAPALLRASAAIRREAGDLDTAFPAFTEAQKEELKASLLALSECAERISGALTGCGQEDRPSVRDDLSLTVKMEASAYEATLRAKMGVELSELLAWNQEEIEKTRAEVFSIAEKLCGKEEVPADMEGINSLLFRNEPPAKDAAEMVERARSYLKRARKVAHEYVKLPEDEEVLCLPIPFALKDGYPWGGYEGGDFRKRPLTGQMFLNQYNVPNISDGWIRMNAMHEAYPGHHVQFVRAFIDETPETVKIGAKLIPLLEGTCLRTERAFEDTYPEDPWYPLFVAYRRHHTSVRIFVDLQLFYYGATIGEAVEIYKKELGLDFVTARAQVQAHQNSPGYFTCYYYGMKKICSLETELGFSKKDFTELCFSAGYVSMGTFEMLARMTGEERERYYHEFKSLLREDPAFDPGVSRG